MIPKNDLEKLYCEALLTDAEIGKLFDVSQATISRWRAKNGISTLSRYSRFDGKCPQPTEDQEQIILGTLLGDGHLTAPGERGTNRRSMLEICHSSIPGKRDQSKYIMWLSEQLGYFCHGVKKIRGGRQMRLRSKASGYLSDLHPFLYSSGRKSVTQDFLDRLSPLAVAVWYMDDGGVQSRNKRACKISTHNFNLEEHRLFVEWFRIKFNIKAIIQRDRQYYCLRFNWVAATKLWNLVEPHMPACMAYKIGDKSPPQTCYLAGAIEAADDEGRTWRERYKKEFDVVGLEAWIPNDLNLEHELTMEQWKVLKARDDLKEFKTEFRKRIIKPDIQAVDDADIIVVRWDGEQTTGTAHEVGRAYLRGQMIYLVTPRPFREVPAWMLACVEAEFHGLEQLTKYLHKRYKLRRKPTARKDPPNGSRRRRRRNSS